MRIVRGFGGEVQGKSVEVGLAEFVPAGGDWVGAGHEAGIEVTDEDLGAFAAGYVVDLFAVGHGGEIRVERRVWLVDLGEDANACEARPVVIVGAGDGANAGDGVAGADAEGVEGMGGGEDVMVVPSCGRQGEDEVTTQFADDARGFSNGEQSEEDNGGRGSCAGGDALYALGFGCRGDAHCGEEGKKEGEEGGAEVAVFDVDDAVDAESGDAEAKWHEPEGVGRGSPGGVQACSQKEENGEEGIGLGVVAHVAEDAHNALTNDDDLETQIHVGLDALVEEGGVEPVGIGAVGELFVAEDGRVVVELLFGMLEMDVGGTEERGLVWLEVHLLGAGDEPDVVEVAGVAEVEAALLVGERGDVGAGDDGEADEDEDSRCGDSGDGLALPEETEGDESQDAEEGEDEGEGFREIGKAEGEAHESGVT